eukprot:SAG25_NODE_176_length_12787_cov_14.980060_2_plen_1127_part_00
MEELDEAEDEEGVTPTVHEATEELVRLRDDLVVTREKTSEFVMADVTQPATIPAGVPKLPSRFQSTEQIRELTRIVLSTSAQDMAMARVGFFGMGGIGKTVTGASIVRNEAVRQHFHAIVWLPLGQTPVVAKLQNLCYMQCTGKELSAELSSEEKQQALQQAMTGKKVLLCLDDLWEEQHESELNFADVSAGSKVLISTRVQGLLVGAHQVEVGLPSRADSARMLLSAAGVDEEEGEPSGVREVVDLCGRLPLALGIAGRLAASLGLVGTRDWRGMLAVLKEELHESHSGGTEEGMIRASLRGLKGSAEEQANVRTLLLLFALVPEDTYAPLAVLRLMFNAISEGPAASIMHIRKWLRILINRSLVLGTVDRPSVHDLVLDFAVAQHSKEQLRLNHRAIVESFRSSRPADAHGRRKFDSAHRTDSMCVYVCNEIEYHVSHALEADSSRDELATRVWLADVPQDVIVMAAAVALGSDRVSELAAGAEASADWWLAARYWGLLQSLGRTVINGLHTALVPTVNALAAMDRLGTIAESERDKEDFHLGLVALLASCWDLTGDLARRPELVKGVLATKATERDPAKVGIIQVATAVTPACMLPDIELCGKVVLDSMTFLLRSAESDLDPAMRHKCLASAFNFAQVAPVMWQHPEFAWDTVYGSNGAHAIAATDAYDYDTTHEFLNKQLSGDWLVTFAGPCAPLAMHWGDMHQVDKMMDHSLLSMQRMMQESDTASETVNLIVGLSVSALLVWSCRMSARRRETLANMMSSYKMSWSAVEVTCTAICASLDPMRNVGDRDVDGHLHAGEVWVELMKCCVLLMASELPASEAEILRSLPSVESIITDMVTRPIPSGHLHAVCHTTHVLLNAFLSCAYVCEKLGRHDKALTYAVAGLVPDFEKGGTTLVVSRVLLLSVQARALAALDRPSEAGPVFLQAVDEAHRFGFHLYEALALRDLKVCVLDGMGHGEHGSRLLGAALRLLTGPPDRLSAILDGVDAAEMMALAAPDPSYELGFGSEDAGQKAVRHELASMKMSVLRRRAQAEGVEDAAMEEASDGSNERRDLVQLIMERQVSVVGTQYAELRAELAGLKMSALRRRAVADGVASERVDEAADGDDERGSLIQAIVDRCG